MKTLALLIDGDNAQLGSTKQIIQFCEVFGTLKIKQAYGDWKQPPLSAHCQTISELGVKCVQQNRVGPNATDMRLAMAVALMLNKGEVDIYFLVSSDNHFTAVCEQIRQTGAKVIGIGSKSQTSSELRKLCNMFFDVEEIVENQSKTSTKPKAKATPAPKTPPTPKVKAAPAPKAKAATVPEAATPAMLELLIQAHQKTPQKKGWVLLPQLREVLRQLDNQFDKRFANKRLSTWFKAFPHQFEVAGDRVRMK